MTDYLKIFDSVEYEKNELYEKTSSNTDCDKRLSAQPTAIAPGLPYDINDINDKRYGIPISELRELAGKDWPECERDPAVLESFVRAVQTRRLRERGETPPHYTSTTTCRHCGTVPIFPGCPARVEACVWCLNRHAGKPVPVIQK